MRAVAPDGGARGEARLRAGGGVFDHQAARGVHAQVRGRGEVDVGVRLGARQVVAAEDALPEVRRHAGHADLHHHLGPVGTRSAGDAARRVAVRGDDRVQRAGDGLQLGHQALIAARVEGAHPLFGERLSSLGFDERALVAHRAADEMVFALGGCERPARLVEHLAQHAVGDGLAVHQHAIAVEQDRVKPFHQCMSPST